MPTPDTNDPGLASPHTVDAVRDAARLVDYLKERLVLVPVTEVGDLVTGGFVAVETAAGCAEGRTEDRIRNGDRVWIDPAALDRLRRAGRWNPPGQRGPDLRYEDDDLLVAWKAAGVHVHPLGDRRDATLLGALLHHAGARPDSPWAAWRPHAVQRLDFVVSGLLVVAKGPAAKAALVRAQERGLLQRRYHAMLRGVVAGDEGVVEAPVGREPGRGYRRAVLPVRDGGRPARTRWRVLARMGDRTLVEFRPETGRTHQLRVHAAHLGHPIVGDDLYAAGGGDGADPRPIGSPDSPSRPIALHACRVALPHPRTGEEIVVESPPPPAFGRAD